MVRACFIILAVAGLFASLLPSGHSPSTSLNGTSNPVATSQSANEIASGQFPAAVELKRDSSGHFYADAKINDMPVRMLVDTGSSGIALSRADAEQVGLIVPSPMFEVVGRGADGDVLGEHVVLDRVSLGPKTAEATAAIVVNSGNTSLLGQSFLRQFDTIEIHGDTMVLR
jgi:aspartyl protease family protein